MRFSFGPSYVHHHAAPTLGEHTDELLGHVLGLSSGELARLRHNGVFGNAIDGVI